MTIIKDGTGTGQLLRVDSGGRARTISYTQLLSGFKSTNGDLFGMGTGFLSLPASFDGRVMLIENTSNLLNFHVTKLIFGCDGGTFDNDVNHEVFQSLIRYNETVPTGNFVTTNIALNENKTSNKSADLTVYVVDDESTSGMTGTTGGVIQIPNMINAGNTSLGIDGEIVFGPGQTMSFNLLVSGQLRANVSMVGFFAEDGEIST